VTDDPGQVADYCRQIETYLCRKNDGHLIRVAGPSFDLVTGWAHRGVPLRVAFRGIDRYFERYYSKTPRRRPVRIDFCEADVLDVFDEWRRATGLAAVPASHAAETGDERDGAGVRRGVSLPAHLQRALERLTAARTSGALDSAFDSLLDRLAHELDCAPGLRGEKRRALIERLALLDRELIDAVREALDPASAAAIADEADSELAAFRPAMTAEAFDRARQAAIDRIVRERLRLPTLAFQ
jgi:hypothetical protein